MAEFTPISFEPLTTHQLLAAVGSPSSPVDLVCQGTNVVIDGVFQKGAARVRMKGEFLHGPAPFALVAGGWLPMLFSIPQYFLVDRNVVARLRRIREQGPRDGDASFHWWTNIFEGAAGLFNPLPYAYEGRYRRIPSLQEFESAFVEGVLELREAFPNASVVEYERVQVESAYQHLMSLQERSERETRFLLEAVPLVLNRVSRERERVAQGQVLQLASRLSVSRDSLVVLAVLSVLYEDVHGNPMSVGRRLLKPTANYSAADSYNAVSDLRHIELAALSHSVLPEHRFALCTNDLGIALFWTSLEIRGGRTEESLFNVHYGLGNDLFARLTEQEIGQVLNALKE